jgi:hypothetical protein
MTESRTRTPTGRPAKTILSFCLIRERPSPGVLAVLARRAIEPASEPADHPKGRKLADHPHWWTIILSLIAIVVSGLSYLESHRSRLLNEAVDRPLVRLVSVDPGQPALGKVLPTGPRLPRYYGLKLRNSGKSYANNVKVVYKAQLEDMRCCEKFLRSSDSDDESTDSVLVGDLAPDDEYDLSLWAYVLKENPTIQFGDHRINMVSLYIVVETEYTSPINNATYHEHFCFVDSGTNDDFRRCSSKGPKYK